MSGNGAIRVFHLCATTLDSHYFANLGRGCARHGIQILGGSLSEKRAPVWLQQIEGSRYFYLHARRHLAYPRSILALAGILRQERIDILQTHLFDAGIVGLAAARLSRVPVTVLTRHHTDEMRFAGTRWHVLADRLMAREADHVVVLSHAVRAHMTAREGADAAKIEVIDQGFDFDALAATDADRQRVRAELGLGSDFVVGCIARFFKTKGHVYLLAAVRELAESIPNIRLLLLGDGDRSAIEAMVREQGLDGRVTFGGYRADVPACLRAMDVVVHPSVTEAFCQTIVEALAAGAPLVVTDVAAASEVVTDGETGLLVPPADPGAIARAVLQIHHNPGLGRRMADSGQRSVRERFTIERMVAQQVDCYRRWLRQAHAGGTEQPEAAVTHHDA